MVGRTGSIRPGLSWAGDTPPGIFVQFLIFAGQGRLPARHFETRAANRLLKDKKLRVFSDALDRNWRVAMSRADAAGDPNSASDLEFSIGHLCIHTSPPFVSSVRNAVFLPPNRSKCRACHPSQLTGGGAFGRNNAGTGCGNVHRDKTHPSAYGGRGTQPRARLIGIEAAGKFLRSEAAEAAMNECDLPGEGGCAISTHVFPANRRVCRPEGRKRGLKACR